MAKKYTRYKRTSTAHDPPVLRIMPTTRDIKRLRTRVTLQIKEGLVYENTLSRDIIVYVQTGKRTQRQATQKEANLFYRKRKSLPNGSTLICQQYVEGKRKLVIVSKRGKYKRDASPQERGRWILKFQQF